MTDIKTLKVKKRGKNILYIDCFSGISGDMFVGAALDLEEKGLDIDILLKELKKIDLDGYEVTASKEKSGSLYGTRFDVKATKEHPHRNFRKIKTLINKSFLGQRVKDLALQIFSEIARAESKIHSKPRDDLHFHEVGAVDSIIDIVCAALVIDLLDVEKVYGSRIPLGKGKVKTMHGLIPVPAPATLEILKGAPVYGGGSGFEVTTPTGAAIMKVLVEQYGEIPDLIVESTGLGAGTREVDSNKDLPNMLRLVLGKHPDHLKKISSRELKSGGGVCTRALLMSTNIDDSSPEILGYTLEKIMRSAALDAWIEPIYMKKNRASYKLCVLCSREKMDDAMKIIFTETSTLGIRIQEITRFTLQRTIHRVTLPYGEVEIKTGIFEGREVTFSPEYSSCVRLAKKTGRSLKEIYRDALLFRSKR